jgi:hypothetical protein
MAPENTDRRALVNELSVEKSGEWKNPFFRAGRKERLCMRGGGNFVVKMMRSQRKNEGIHRDGLGSPSRSPDSYFFIILFY